MFYLFLRSTMLFLYSFSGLTFPVEASDRENAKNFVKKYEKSNKRNMDPWIQMNPKHCVLPPALV